MGENNYNLNEEKETIVIEKHKQRNRLVGKVFKTLKEYGPN